MKKIIIRLLLGLIILCVAVVLVAGLFMGSIVKKGLLTFGPEIAKVDIKVEAVRLNLFSGSGTVKGLVVGNPKGYKAEKAFSVKEIGISVSPLSLFSDKVVIRSIRIDAPEITFEGGAKKNNLTKIVNNVNASVGGKKKEQGTGDTREKRLQVDDLLITGTKIQIGSGNITLNALPDIHMTDLGITQEGITTGELAKQVLEELETAVLTAVAGSIMDLGKGAVDAVGAAGEGAAKKGLRVIDNIFKKKK